jgi:hypothetical protein
MGSKMNPRAVMGVCAYEKLSIMAFLELKQNSKLCLIVACNVILQCQA